MKRMIGLGCLLLCLLSACARAPSEVSRSSFMLDTFISVTLYDWEEESTLSLAMSEIDRLEKLLSVEQEGSDLYRLSQAAGVDWVEISPECQEVLERAKEYWRLSEGLFDVTTGPLVDLWAIRDGSGHYPTQKELEETLPRISSDWLLVEEGRAFLSREGMKANLGAIAKGYIADQIKELLRKEGVEHGIINLGGNVLLLGGKTKETPFHIAIESPFTESGMLPGYVKAVDQSIVTAGVYQRFFTYEGVEYHHVLDPLTGFPADTGLVSVTIISPDSIDGDALSTSCLLLGAEKGLALIEGLPEVEALFLTTENETILSSGFGAYYQE